MKSSARYARIATLALVATFLVALVPGKAAACSCMPVTTQEMVADAHTVFVGEEVSRTRIDRGAAGDTWLTQAVTFRVVEAYKGSVTDQFTVYTGMGGGDCGVGPLTGLVGITISGGGEPSISICGSVHDAAEVAQLLEPIDLVTSEPEPPPLEPGGVGLGGVVIAFGIALVIVGIGRELLRRRRQAGHDGWSSEG